MNEDNVLSPLEAEMIAGLSAFRDALAEGASIEERFTVRTIRLDLKTRPYGPEDVKAFRLKLRASQSLLAKFLGVSVKTLRSWEQNRRPVPEIACRFMDEVQANPELWTRRLQASTATQ